MDDSFARGVTSQQPLQNRQIPLIAGQLRHIGARGLSLAVVQANGILPLERQSALVALLEQLGVAAGIVVLDRIPLTPTGKPDRVRLRKLLGAQHAGKETIIHLKDLT